MPGKLRTLKRNVERNASQVWERASNRYPRLDRARIKLALAIAPSLKPEGDEPSVKPQNLIWIFGSGRSGSTWLLRMMREMPYHRGWQEPLVGQLFGQFYYASQERNLRRRQFIMSDETRDLWTNSIRNFILDGARYAHPGMGPRQTLVIKEPNGSQGAPLIMEALPESRMVFLVRDPRDTVASTLDAARKDGWLYEATDNSGWKQNALADSNPDVFVRRRAAAYLSQVGNTKQAFEAHEGPKALVRYEELRADPLNTMRRLYSDLRMDVEEAELVRAVEKHSWENIPEDKKGEGKVFRKAKPGGWKDDLTPEQVRIVEKITAPLLEEFYAKR